MSESKDTGKTYEVHLPQSIVYVKADVAAIVPHHWAPSCATPILTFYRDVDGDGKGEVIAQFHTWFGYQVTSVRSP